MRTGRLAVACAALVSRGLWAAAAGADDIDEGVAFKSVAIQGNPLGIAIGRYSADLEYLPEPHHALHLTGLGYYALPGVDDQFDGFGAEAGYRWYSGTHGPHGLFLGASAVAGSYHYVHSTESPSPLDTPDDTHFIALGGAIDAGWQAIVLGHLAVGVGAGAQYTLDLDTPHFEYATHRWHDLFYGAGLRPRALLQVGAAF
jgi:hypothetical protein